MKPTDQIPSRKFVILLADDDSDDCYLFDEALKQLSVSAELIIVQDGEELMQLLQKFNEQKFPDVLFLDLNMPRKSGMECLSEINSDDQLKQLPVVICSTSLDNKVADQLYKNGASYYIQKPADFSSLKKIIQEALNRISNQKRLKSNRDEFILQA